MASDYWEKLQTYFHCLLGHYNTKAQWKEWKVSFLLVNTDFLHKGVDFIYCPLNVMVLFDMSSFLLLFLFSILESLEPFFFEFRVHRERILRMFLLIKSQFSNMKVFTQMKCKRRFQTSSQKIFRNALKMKLMVFQAN